MKNVFLTILLIIITSSIYIGYKWVTVDEKPEKNVKVEVANDNDDELIIEEQASSIYEDLFDEILQALNEQSHLIQGENVHIISLLDKTDLISNLNIDGQDVSISAHTYSFDDVREPVNEDVFNQYYTKESDYDVNDEIEGIIAYDEVFEEYVFLQTNRKQIDYPLSIQLRGSEKAEEIIDILEEIELKEEREITKEEMFADYINMDIDNLYAFNLDNDDIELRLVDIFKFNGEASLNLQYNFQIDGEEVSGVLEIREARNVHLSGKELTLDNRRTVYKTEADYIEYRFVDQGYEYQFNIY